MGGRSTNGSTYESDWSVSRTLPGQRCSNPRDKTLPRILKCDDRHLHRERKVNRIIDETVLCNEEGQYEVILPQRGCWWEPQRDKETGGEEEETGRDGEERRGEDKDGQVKLFKIRRGSNQCL